MTTPNRRLAGLYGCVFVACVFLACPGPGYEINYEYGTVPSVVTNWVDINTQWDDMNSAGPPTIHNSFTLFLATNRATQGLQFDLHWFHTTVEFQQTDELFWIYSSGPFGSCGSPISSPVDEFGPLLLTASEASARLLFSSARTGGAGGLDIYFTNRTSVDELTYNSADSIVAVMPAHGLNSQHDDAYPTFGPDSCAYFCSNRGGVFDIYYCQLPGDPIDHIDSIDAWLQGTSGLVVQRADVLSSSADDKCPFIQGTTMWLVSSRAGGQGGFDIWTSTFEAGAWQPPAVYDSTVNSSYDEHRPVCFVLDDFTNKLLLFSSNRPGGLGGYDMYYRGTD